MVSNNFIRKNENQFDGLDVSNFDAFKIMSGQGIFIVLEPYLMQLVAL